MIVSISQPAYFPWLGYFDRMAQSDIAIVLDNVMLERSSKTRFTNRNRIRTESGAIWLTVPVKTAGIGQPLISDAELDLEQKWAQKHFRSLAQFYGHTPYFSDHRNWLEHFYSRPWTHLAPLLRESTGYLLDKLQIRPQLLFSSELNVIGQKHELILNLCKHVGATTYLSGPFGRDYLDAEAFLAAGIELKFHDYQHPVYSQAYQPFEPYMSVVDLLFNCGDSSRQILSSK
jgi:hypothetical protein